MIRERVPLAQFGVKEERIQSLYRLWICLHCGIEFSIRAQVEPKFCPVCLCAFNDTAVPVRLSLGDIEERVERLLRGQSLSSSQSDRIKLVVDRITR